MIYMPGNKGSLIMHALINYKTDRQLLMVIELINYACMHMRYAYAAHRLSSRDVVLTFGGNRGRRHVALWQQEWQPLCLSVSLGSLSLSGFLSC